MPVGPRRIMPLSRKVARKPVRRPRSVSTGQTGVVSDQRPLTTTSNLQRTMWGIQDRPNKGDWT